MDFVSGYLTFILGYGIFVQNYFEIFKKKNQGYGIFDQGVLLVLEQTMRNGTFFRAGQCAALSSFRVG